jgi:excisionase family DNA binding protein
MLCISNVNSENNMALPMTNQNEQSLFLKAEEVAFLLGLKKSTIYALVKRGELPAYQFGKSVKFKRSDLDEYIEKSKVKIKTDES